MKRLASQKQFKAFPLSIPISFFREIEKKNMKIRMEAPRTIYRQSNVEGENNADLKLYYKAIVAKTEERVH